MKNQKNKDFLMLKTNLVVYDLRVSKYFGLKKPYKKKFDKKDVKSLCKVFLCQTVLIFPISLYIYIYIYNKKSV